MKSSKEWLSDIQEKAEKRFAAQKKRRKMIVRISSSAVCLALILCSVAAVPNLIGSSGFTITMESSGTNQTLDNESTNNDYDPSDVPPITSPSSAVTPTDNPKTDTSSTPSVEDPNVHDGGKKLFAANKIVNQISAAPKYHDPKEHRKELWTKEQITEYLGIDLTALSPYMPTDLAYTPRGDFRILFHNSGKIVEDYQSFVYEGKNNRKAEILVGKVVPPYDCLYKLETDDTTFVSNAKVLFGVKSNGNDSSEYDFCYADFMDGGLYYRVKAENMTPREFYKIVEGIIELK